MIAKVIYFNWRKAENEDNIRREIERNAPNMKAGASLKRVTWSGELLDDRPDLYD